MRHSSVAPSTKQHKKIEEILRQRLVTGVWRPNDRLPTEKELAQELNVCAATVQRHLRELQKEGLIWGRRGKGRFVSGLGQRPRTGNIGVVLFDSRHMANPATSELVASVGAVAAEAEKSLRIFIGNDLSARSDGSNAGNTGPGAASFLGSPTSMGVDGLIMLTQRISPETIRQLGEIVPVVSANLLPIPNVSCIVIDVASGAFDATRHLIDLGHHRIAVLTKDVSDSFGRAIHDGARLAIGNRAAAGKQPVTLEMLAAAEFTESEGYGLAKRLISRGERPTAIICGDHAMAIGVLQAVDEAGLQIPRDLSLVSWNKVLVDRSPVSITSICFDRADVGTRLCRRLLECMEHPERQFPAEYVPPTLVVRESTAPPAAGASSNA